MRHSRQSVLFPLILVSAAKIYGAEFQVEGDLISVYSPLPSQSVTNIRPFRVSVRDCKCKIRVEANSRDKGIEYFEYVYDGTNSYQYAKYKKRNSTDGQVKKKSSNDSTIVVRNENVPSVSAMITIPIWLAYGSGCYFAEKSDNKIANLHLLQGSESFRKAQGDINLDAKWKLSMEPPFLLESMTDFLSGEIRKDLKWYPLPKEVATGRRNSHFSVARWRNEGALKIPSEFIYSEWSTSTDVTDDTAPLMITRGIARIVVEQAVDDEFSVEISDAVRVVERRYSSELRELFNTTATDYISTNKTFKSLETIVHDIKSSQPGTAPAVKEKTSPSMIRNLLLIGVAILLLPAFLIAKLRREKLEKKHNKNI